MTCDPPLDLDRDLSAAFSELSHEVAALCVACDRADEHDLDWDAVEAEGSAALLRCQRLSLTLETALMHVTGSRDVAQHARYLGLLDGVHELRDLLGMLFELTGRVRDELEDRTDRVTAQHDTAAGLSPSL